MTFASHDAGLPAHEAISSRGLDPAAIATTFAMHGERYAVVFAPSTTPAALATLTPSERDVALAILAGQSNRAIAAARGTAVRTVANQIAALFRKLGISSRAELGACVHQRARGET